MRDGFSVKTKELLAKQAGFRCANPACRAPTVGGKPGDPSGVLNLGEAAHIQAASSGGPRYDATMTTAQRAHPDNGVWLCRNHAAAVDKDPATFPASLLRAWKEAARRQSFLDLVGDVGVAAMAATLPEDGRRARVLAASRADLDAHKNDRRWPRHAIKLRLHLLQGEARQVFDADGLALATALEPELVMVAPPGSGKSTSLLQIASAVVETRGVPALFMRLNDWAARPDQPLLGAAAARPRFQGCTVEDFQALADSGELCLLLDGWNELSPQAVDAATVEVERLRGAYPRLAIVLSTRLQSLSTPLKGQIVEVEALSEDQQMEIARSVKPDGGEALVDAAWRTPGVRDLVTIPLYLNTLLNLSSGAALPSTREGIIGAFAAEHARPDVNARALRRRLHDRHDDLLVALAAAATERGATSLAETEARTILKAAADAITAQGEGAFPSPADTLTVLIDHHSLVRSPGDVGTVSFQHQQIQEWYASRAIEQDMRAAVANADARARLGARLDDVEWEEAAFFAIERLSRADDAGVGAAATAIRSALAVDPMLAAEMVARGDDRVWAAVAETLQAYGHRWHSAGVIDRGFRFMCLTGRPEFATSAWPLLTNANRNIRADALHAVRRLSHRVLGPDALSALQGLSEEVRADLLHELAMHGDVDAMAAAVAWARADPSPAVQAEVVEGFDFRRADRAIVEVLKHASDAVWTRIARRGHPEHLIDSTLDARLQAERRALAASAPSREEQLWMIVRSELVPAQNDPEITRLIADPAYPVYGDRPSHALYRAMGLRPQAAAKGLLARLEANLDVPRDASKTIRQAGVSSDSELLQSLLMTVGGEQRVPVAAAAAAGPLTVDRLIEAFLEADAARPFAPTPIPQDVKDRYDWFRRLLDATHPATFVAAVLRTQTTTMRARVALIERIAAHGEDYVTTRLDLPEALREAAAERLNQWGDELIADETSRRGHLERVARAVSRIGSVTCLPLVSRLLAEDRRRLAVIAALPLARRREADNTGYHQSYRLAYEGIGGEPAKAALRPMLTDPDFGFEAAIALRSLRDGAAGYDRPWGRDGELYQEGRSLVGRREAIEPDAKVMFDAVRTLLIGDPSPKHVQAAFQIAVVAYSFTVGQETELAAALLAMPAGREVRRALIKTLLTRGYAVSAGVVLAEIRKLYEDAKTEPWLLTEGHRLQGLLELLPFTDQPEAIFEIMPQMEPRQRRPWELESMVRRLGQTPAPNAVAVLAKLAQEDPAFVGRHEWRTALLDIGTVEAVELLVTALGTAGEHASSDGWLRSDVLSGAMGRNPALRPWALETLTETDNARVAGMLMGAIAEAPSEDEYMILLDRYARDGKPFDGRLHHAIRNLAIHQIPLGEDSNSYELVPASCGALRRRLFALTVVDPKLAALAEASLKSIDNYRDDYGIPRGEPRHPDLASGRPWPLPLEPLPV